jgi:hypothetical protein
MPSFHAAGGLIGLAVHHRQSPVDVRMMIPLLIRDVDVHKANSTFDESSSNETARSKFAGLVLVQSVELRRRRGFVRKIEGFLRCHLHPCGQFIAGDPGLKIVLSGILLQVLAIELVQERELFPLGRTA